MMQWLKENWGKAVAGAIAAVLVMAVTFTGRAISNELTRNAVELVATEVVTKADLRYHQIVAFNEYVKQATVVELKGERRDVERRISDLEVQAKYEEDPVRKAILEERIKQAKEELESVSEDLEAAQ